MVIKATRTIPRAAIQEVAARATSPGRAVSRTTLRSQDEEKGQKFTGGGRNSDRDLRHSRRENPSGLTPSVFSPREVLVFRSEPFRMSPFETIPSFWSDLLSRLVAGRDSR